MQKPGGVYILRNCSYFLIALEVLLTIWLFCSLPFDHNLTVTNTNKKPLKFSSWLLHNFLQRNYKASSLSFVLPISPPHLLIFPNSYTCGGMFEKVLLISLAWSPQD